VTITHNASPDHGASAVDVWAMAVAGPPASSAIGTSQENHDLRTEVPMHREYARARPDGMAERTCLLGFGRL